MATRDRQPTAQREHALGAINSLGHVAKLWVMLGVLVTLVLVKLANTSYNEYVITHMI